MSANGETDRVGLVPIVINPARCCYQLKSVGTDELSNHAASIRRERTKKLLVGPAKGILCWRRKGNRKELKAIVLFSSHSR